MNAPLPAVRAQPVGVDIFANAEAFEHAQRVATMFSKSSLVPPHLRNNVADCLIAYHIAKRLGEEPLVVMQNIYVVSGRPGWKTEYVLARARRAGVFTGPVTWKEEGAGDTLSVTASAALKDSGEVVSATCDMRMAKAEQWTKNAKYQSMPAHMLKWRSAAMLVRLYAPEVMIGLPVIEEIETQEPAAMRDVTPAQNIGAALDAFAAETTEPAADAPQAEEQQPETQAGPERDPRAKAYEAGEAACDAGLKLSAVPGEYRDSKELSEAWKDGHRNRTKAREGGNAASLLD